MMGAITHDQILTHYALGANGVPHSLLESESTIPFNLVDCNLARHDMPKLTFVV